MAFRIVAAILIAVTASAASASSPHLSKLRQEAYELTVQRRFEEATTAYRDLHREAMASLDKKLAVFSLNSMAGCNFHLYRYREAMKLYEQAYDEARQNKDAALESMIAANITSLWSALGETSKAIAFARRYAISGAGLHEDSRLDWHVILLQVYGRAKDRASFEQILPIALREADLIPPAALRMANADRNRRWPEALGELRRADLYDVLSDALAEFGDFPVARDYALQAYRLRFTYGDPRRLRSLVQLGVLARKLDRTQEALGLIETASRLDSLKPSPMQLFRIHRERGLLLMKLGRFEESLNALREALRFPRAWRTEVLPTDSTYLHFEAFMNGQIHEEFLTAILSLPDAKMTTKLAAETFWVAEEARFASMRASLFPRDQVSYRLGDAYWPLLQRFQAVQAEILAGKTSYLAERDGLELRLTSLESKAGLAIPHARAGAEDAFEKWRAQLPADETLFSYYLASPHSLAWAVTSRGIEMRKIAGRSELLRLSQQFSAAVRSRSETFLSGSALARELFGEFSLQASTRPFWTVVVDDFLAQTPLAALPMPHSSSGNEADLVLARHTLRALPSAIFLGPLLPSPWQGTSIGFADPVYNSADSRVAFVRSAAVSTSGLQLNRLPASAVEVADAFRTLDAKHWTSKVHLGVNADIAHLHSSIQAAPDILHVATHFAADPARPELTSIALSSTNGQPAFFSALDLTGLRTRSKVVILSGCSSASGASYPGIGVAGLSRAWLVSGAQSVIGTLWPIDDVSGPLFPLFYSHLTAEPYTSRHAALSLRRSQLAMLRRKDRFSQPSYWAAFTTLARN